MWDPTRHMAKEMDEDWMVGYLRELFVEDAIDVIDLEMGLEHVLAGGAVGRVGEALVFM